MVFANARADDMIFIYEYVPMYDVMNSVNGSRTHDEIIKGKVNDSNADEDVLDWYLRMQEQMRCFLYEYVPLIDHVFIILAK